MYECLSRQVKTCETQIDALRMRGRLSSLSDEVLAVILEHATNDSDTKHEGSTAALAFETALKLSHVCQRFRGFVMRDPCLWNRIYNGMNLPLVSALCDRITKPTPKSSWGKPNVVHEQIPSYSYALLPRAPHIGVVSITVRMCTAEIRFHCTRAQLRKNFKSWHARLVNFMSRSLPNLPSTIRTLLPVRFSPTMTTTIQRGQRRGCVPLPSAI